jgi:hypothetical protein
MPHPVGLECKTLTCPTCRTGRKSIWYMGHEYASRFELEQATGSTYSELFPDDPRATKTGLRAPAPTPGIDVDALLAEGHATGMIAAGARSAARGKAFHRELPDGRGWPCGRCLQCTKGNYPTCTRPAGTKSLRDNELDRPAADRRAHARREAQEQLDPTVARLLQAYGPTGARRPATIVHGNCGPTL